MIDAARALRNETIAKIDTHEAEIARLRLLADALETFIEQPEQGSAVSSTGSPAPADRGSDPADDGAPAGTRRPATAPANQRPAASSLTCPKCGRDTFTRPNTLAMHVKHCDGIGTQRIRIQPSQKPTIPPPVTIRASDPQPDEPPRPSERPTIAERIAARDATRNPRSVPHLELPPRIDRVAGE